MMWIVYLQFGIHIIYDCTNEEFEKVKKLYHLFETKEGRYTNKRGDIYAWKKGE